MSLNKASERDLDFRAGDQYSTMHQTSQVAVLVPCFNEEVTVGVVVARFKAALPDATIYVYDNNSTDATIERAVEAGAIVRTERRQGKGHVLRRMFADIEADAYLLVDGDDTYDATVAPDVVARLLEEGLDFVNVARISTAVEAYRPGHRLGNRVLTDIVRLIFGRDCSDMLSGYKGSRAVSSKVFLRFRADLRPRLNLRCTRSSYACRWANCPRLTKSGPPAVPASCARIGTGGGYFDSSPVWCATKGRCASSAGLVCFLFYAV